MNVIKRLLCTGCGEVRRVKLVDGREPECPVCGPTIWMAFPRVNVAQVQADMEDAQRAVMARMIAEMYGLPLMMVRGWNIVAQGSHW